MGSFDPYDLDFSSAILALRIVKVDVEGNILADDVSNSPIGSTFRAEQSYKVSNWSIALSTMNRITLFQLPLGFRYRLVGLFMNKQSQFYFNPSFIIRKYADDYTNGTYIAAMESSVAGSYSAKFMAENGGPTMKYSYTVEEADECHRHLKAISEVNSGVPYGVAVTIESLSDKIEFVG